VADITIAVSKVINTLTKTEECTEIDVKVLKACFRMLHEAIKAGVALAPAAEVLHIKRLDQYVAAHVPSGSGVHTMGTEISRAFTSSSLRRTPAHPAATIVVEYAKGRGNPTLRSPPTLSNTSNDDPNKDSTQDSDMCTFDTTSYESLSSASSVPSSPTVLAQLQLSFDDEDW
jgi:hypothetical protein